MELPAQVTNLVERLRTALAISQPLRSDGPRERFPGQGTEHPDDLEQDWSACSQVSAVQVSTSGFFADPSGFAGGTQTWRIEVETHGARLSIVVEFHQFSGYSTHFDPRDRSRPEFAQLFSALRP